MSNALFKIPEISNEPILSYKEGSLEKKEVLETYQSLYNQKLDIPMYIGDKEVRTKKKIPIHCPHDHQHILGHFYEGDEQHVKDAIAEALKVKKNWENMPWHDRVSIFIKAAELIAGPYRSKINAATMLGQSKNVFQAEIDAACELVDFLKFNAKFLQQIYEEQPLSQAGVWNRLEYRALEGFIFAITPFNFTAIGGNLSLAPAMAGNVVIWKPSYTQIYSANVIMEVLHEAGLPKGVVNLIYVDGPIAGDVVFNHPEFAGLHFTGSTNVFQHLWKTIGEKIETYHSYPKIVGETGGKDFVVAHASANAREVAIGLIRGAFEYQGQKCSAASRAYIPSNLWGEVKKILKEEMSTIKVGSPDNFKNFVNAVIDEKSYKKITNYIEKARQDSKANIIIGGTYSNIKGWFINPTVIEVSDPKYTTMCEEIFGPVLSIYVYEEQAFESILETVDTTSPYALTGAIFSRDRNATILATKKLRHAAGNFYINDKPTGAVVGQQPFGGARGSGTNDKAGSLLNLIRWMSPRTIKETFVPPKDYGYDFMK